LSSGQELTSYVNKGQEFGQKIDTAFRKQVELLVTEGRVFSLHTETMEAYLSNQAKDKMQLRLLVVPIQKKMLSYKVMPESLNDTIVAKYRAAIRCQ